MEKYEKLYEKVRKGERVNVLLVSPKVPEDTLWGLNRAFEISGEKASMVSLGLTTIPGLFPENFSFNLIDMNIEKLTNEHIINSDIVATSSMVVQTKSLEEVIFRANEQGKMVLVGGPNPTEYFDKIKGEVVFVLNEGERTIPLFNRDLKGGKVKRVYSRLSVPKREEDKVLVRRHLDDLFSFFGKGEDVDIKLEGNRPRMADVPIPRYDLVKMKAYNAMPIQLSRGCPNGCDFCNVRVLYGSDTRYAPVDRSIKELSLLYELGWRGNIFICDDNTIAKPKYAIELFEKIAEFQKEHKYPFRFGTEGSINFADNPELLESFRKAGGNSMFIGFETPNEKSLKECNKFVNLKGSKNNEEGINSVQDNLITKIRKIQKKGIEISGGFIIGFDGDKSDIFDRQIRFIQESGISIAMVGLLQALRYTPLYYKLEKEGRILEDFGGDNTHNFRTNFITKMDPQILAEGYKRVLNTIYDSDLKNYFERGQISLDSIGKNPRFTKKVEMRDILTLFKSSKLLMTPFGGNFVKYVVKNVFRNPSLLSEVIKHGILGYHFREITQKSLMEEDLKNYVTLEHYNFIDEFKKSLGEVVVKSNRGLENIIDLGKDKFAEFMAKESDLFSGIKDEVSLYLGEEKEKFTRKINKYYKNQSREYKRKVNDSYEKIIEMVESIDLGKLDPGLF